MLIRQATADDAEAISRLVTELSKRFIVDDFEPHGRRSLLDSMTPAKVAEYIRGPFRFHVAEVNGEIVGVAGIRDARHLYYLFVDERCHRQGIARELWLAARRATGRRDDPAEFSVSASRYAVPAYIRLGSEVVGPEKVSSGVISVPMRWRGSL